MYCTQCGISMDDHARFCAGCGAQQPQAATQASANVYGVSAASMHPATGYRANSHDEAIIGPNNQHYYLQRFAEFDRAGKAGASWHWPAFFVSFYWLLYRKMWGHAAVYFLFPYLFFMMVGVVGAVAHTSPMAAGTIITLGYLAYLGGIFVWVPMYANAMYYKHCRKKIAQALNTSPNPQMQMANIIARGGTSNVILIVVVFFLFFFVIGILAAIAIPAYQNYLARSQITEAINLADGLKTPVTEYALAKGACPDNAQGVVGSIPDESSISGLYTASVHTTSECTIVATMKATGVSQKVAGRSIVLQMQLDSSNNASWTCFSPDIPAPFLPRACQTAPQGQ